MWCIHGRNQAELSILTTLPALPDESDGQTRGRQLRSSEILHSRDLYELKGSYADAFLAAACCALGCVLGTIVLIEERPGPAPLAGIERPLHPAPFANAFVADANHDEVLPPPLPL